MEDDNLFFGFSSDAGTLLQQTSHNYRGTVTVKLLDDAKREVKSPKLKKAVEIVRKYADISDSNISEAKVRFNGDVGAAIQFDGKEVFYNFKTQKFEDSLNRRNVCRKESNYSCIKPKIDYARSPLISSFLEYHSESAADILPVSPLCNDSFPDTFNASGFHENILNLKAGEKVCGVDNCIRHVDFENPDENHKAYFLMGIYAESIKREKDYRDNFTDPAKHEQFFGFQEKIIDRFFDFVETNGIKKDDTSVTFFNGGSIGNSGKNKSERDGILSKYYNISPDKGGLKALKRHIDKSQIYPVKSLENIDINPTEGSLVGPRVEVAVGDFEIATIVFDYYKVNGRKLAPIDYIGGYAVGLERLEAAKNKSDIYSTNFMKDVKDMLNEHIPGAEGFGMLSNSPLLSPSARQMLSSAEALLHICAIPKNTLYESEHRKSHINKLISKVHDSGRRLGVEESDIYKFVNEYAALIHERLPEPFNKTDAETVIKKLKHKHE